MKLKDSLLLLMLLCCSLLQAQIGIGTTSPNAGLDIRSSNQAAPANTDGILIPKVDAFPATNPTALQNGMLVFLTTAAAGNQPGFYYWDNPTTSWKGVGSSLANDWSLLGNAGTNAATNFLGTTDNKDLTIKRNNIRAGFLGDPNTSTGNMNTSFGANSLVSPGVAATRNVAVGTNVMPSITTGNRNVAVGDQSMFLNSTGTENVAVGVGAMYSSTAGVCNVAVGRNALTNTNGLSGTQGSNNTAIGYVALRTNTIGAYNAALGRESLYTNLSGNYNVGLGYQSGYTNSTGSNNVFIGSQAGYFETGSNKLYISNNNADAANALLYGEFDNKIVRANGQIQVNDPTTTGYKFPTARGTNKQILETDGSGNLSWVNGTNTFSLVHATLSTSQGLGTGGWQKLNFNTVAFDINSEFNAGTAKFTAAKAGYYRIDAVMHTNDQTNNQFYSIGIYVNGTLVSEGTANHYGNGPVSRKASYIASLAAGGTVEVYVQNYQSGVNVDSFPSKTYLEIEQIR